MNRKLFEQESIQFAGVSMDSQHIYRGLNSSLMSERSEYLWYKLRTFSYVIGRFTQLLNEIRRFGTSENAACLYIQKAKTAVELNQDESSSVFEPSSKVLSY